MYVYAYVRMYVRTLHTLYYVTLRYVKPHYVYYYELQSLQYYMYAYINTYRLFAECIHPLLTMARSVQLFTPAALLKSVDGA